jgi:hypothetical protein
MAVEDKQIFQLDDIALQLLQSGVKIRFVAQVEGYDLDFAVSPDVLRQYFSGINTLKSYGGSNNPDNASGNNGDLYFQSNGKVYQKANGTWGLVATLSIPGTGTIIQLDPANGDSQSVNAPNGYTFKRCISIANGQTQDGMITQISSDGKSAVIVSVFQPTELSFI